MNRNVRPPTLKRRTTRGSVCGVRLVAAQVTGGVPVARHLAVEREAHGVEHAGLARAGVAGQQEQATGGELVEVDVDGVDEGPNAVIERSWSRISRTPRRRARRRDQGPPSSTRAPHAEGRTRRRWRQPRGRGRRSRAPRRAPTGPSCSQASGCSSPPRRCEPEGQCVREPGAQPLHRLERPDGIGERGLHPGLLVGGVPLVAEQVVDSALEPSELASHRRGDEGGLLEAVGVEVDQPGTLDVVGLRERVGDRRPAVANAVTQRRPAVQVTERGVVDAVEQLRAVRRRRRPRRCPARSRWPARRRRTRAPSPPNGCRRDGWPGRRGRAPSPPTGPPGATGWAAPMRA